MTKMQRIRNILIALYMIACAIMIFVLPVYSIQIISSLIGLSLMIIAIRSLVYYLRLARFMTGGKTFLYRSLILIDLAAFSGVVSTIPRFYIIIYLSVFFGFAGVVDLLRAQEERRLGGTAWRFKTFQGAFNVVMAVLCLVFIRSGRFVELLYGVSLINAAILRLISAFRKSAIVYIA